MTAPSCFDMAESMRTATQARARQIVTILRSRIEDIRHVGWPRLEQSLRDELARAEAIARERGLTV